MLSRCPLRDKSCEQEEGSRGEDGHDEEARIPRPPDLLYSTPTSTLGYEKDAQQAKQKCGNAQVRRCRKIVAEGALGLVNSVEVEESLGY